MPGRPAPLTSHPCSRPTPRPRPAPTFALATALSSSLVPAGPGAAGAHFSRRLLRTSDRVRANVHVGMAEEGEELRHEERERLRLDILS